MWPFRKKYPPISELPNNQWTVGSGEYKQRLLILRLNQACRKICGHPEYAHQVGIAIPLHEPEPDGMPNETEIAVLETIEEQIKAALCANHEAVFAAVITTGGMREFVLYTCNPEATRVRVERLQRTVETHEVQCVIQHDPKWRIYRDLAF